MTAPTPLFGDSPAPAPPSQPESAPTFFELYERELVPPLFRPWAEELVARAHLRDGERVLDVACGTGIVARLAKQSVGALGIVVGVDRSAGMLELARSLDSSIDWREGDAAALPLAVDEQFDAAFCHQGVQFFADRPAAIRAMRDALVPGGRVVIGVWRALEENGAFHDLGVAAERVVGPIRDARHSYSDANALKELLAEAGFSKVRVEEATRTTRFADARFIVQLNTHAVVAMSAAAESMTDADKAAATARIVEESLPLMSRYAEGSGIAFTTAANVAIGYR